MDTLCEPQFKFITDPSRYIVACCGRQVGKDFTSARLMILTALERPLSEIVYIGQTLAEARAIMWSDGVDGLPAVCRALDVGITTNESRLEVTFTNGSKVTLLGLDRGAWDKLRGRRLDLIVLTEMQKAEDEGLRGALDKVIPPALAAKRGRFVGIGTPDEYCVGLLHDICNKPDLFPQFSVHHWDAGDNGRRPDIWADLLNWKLTSGMPDDDPRWLREGRGLWVRQDSSLILPLGPNSLWDGRLPDLIPSRGGVPVPRTPGPHGIPVAYGGLDFGFTNDPAAVVVLAVSREEGVIRHVYGSKHSNLNTQQLAEVIKRVRDEFDVRTFYADSADPKTAEDLRALYRLPVVAADKHQKEPWISEMRAGLISGQLRVLEDSGLHHELLSLQPDPNELRRRRISARPGSVDHEYDAFRYAFRGIRTHHFQAPETPLTEQEVALKRAADQRAEALNPSKGKRRG